MLPELEGQDYKNIFLYFSEIAAIPHGSGNCGPIGDYLEAFARQQSIDYVRDEAGNLVFYLPATKGYETVQTLILQGHMDMVCERGMTSKHDFLLDPLRLTKEGEWLHADQTTLGGDDGIAVAYMLALMADKELPHGALELVLTTDEETGMDGAKALDPALLHGRYLINLDSEEENCLLCGCAGGVRLEGAFPLRRGKTCGRLVEISFHGFLGGHSGTEIDKGRTNAVLFLARLLFMLRRSVDFRVSFVQGGRKDNAIPREANAVLVFPEETAKEDFLLLHELTVSMLAEIRFAEPEAEITSSISDRNTECEVLTDDCFEQLLFFLNAVPNGVQQMSAEIASMVESSLSLGTLSMEEETCMATFLLRSSKESYLQYMKERLCYLMLHSGAKVTESSEYPAWEYRVNSKLKDLYVSCYQEMFHEAPVVTAVHAGLECGIFAKKLDQPEMISIGPDMEDIHTPSERLNVASAIRVYQLLEKMLAHGNIS